MKTLTRTHYSVLGLAAVALWATIGSTGCYRPIAPAPGTVSNGTGMPANTSLAGNTTMSASGAMYANTTSLPNTTQPFTYEPEASDPGWANTLPDLKLSDDDGGLPELSLDDGDLPALSLDPEPKPEPQVEPEPDPEPEPVAVTPVYPPGIKLVPLPLVLPAPAFRGTPVPLTEPNVAKPRGKPREPFPAPAGTVNLALGKAVSSSDPSPTSGELDLVTDGDKEATDFGCLELHPGTEWIQVDLGKKSTIWAAVVWHNHAQARVYRDVVVQVSDDPDFLDEFTVFNNDYDNSSGLGTSNDRGDLDKGYVETSEGGLLDCAGVEGRYVRLYSRGNTIDKENHYTEVEIYGVPKE